MNRTMKSFTFAVSFAIHSLIFRLVVNTFIESGDLGLWRAQVIADEDSVKKHDVHAHDGGQAQGPHREEEDGHVIPVNGHPPGHPGQQKNSKKHKSGHVHDGIGPGMKKRCLEIVKIPVRRKKSFFAIF